MGRTYTIRGKAGKTATHTKIQLSSYDPRVQYKIVEFRIAPAKTTSNSDCYGILTINEQNSLDPTDFNFAAQSQIAWAHACTTELTGIPTPAPSVSEYTLADYDRLFNYDIWCHTQDNYAATEVNFFIKIYKQDTSAEAGSISSLMQYQASQ